MTAGGSEKLRRVSLPHICLLTFLSLFFELRICLPVYAVLPIFGKESQNQHHRSNKLLTKKQTQNVRRNNL